MRISDVEKLVVAVHVAEEALFLRWQELEDDYGDDDERAAMKAATLDLWAIKVHKLGWPAV